MSIKKMKSWICNYSSALETAVSTFWMSLSYLRQYLMWLAVLQQPLHTTQLQCFIKSWVLYFHISTLLGFSFVHMQTHPMWHRWFIYVLSAQQENGCSQISLFFCVINRSLIYYDQIFNYNLWSLKESCTILDFLTTQQSNNALLCKFRSEFAFSTNIFKYMPQVPL